MNLKLIVKVPNNKHSDQSFEIDANWSVKQLKVFLSREHPSKPSLNDQKLIYSGHLLKDDQILLQVFQPLSPNDSIVTIHMVCQAKASEPSSNDQSSQREVINDNLAHGSSFDSNRNHMSPNINHDGNISDANSVDPPSSQAATAAALTSSILSQMNANAATNFMGGNSHINPLAFNLYAAPVLAGPRIDLSPEEENALNQLYTRLLSSQFNNNSVPAPGVPSPFVTNLLQVNSQLAQMMMQQQQQAQPAHVAANHPPPQVPVQPVAQPAGNLDETNNNDWLEWLNWLSRVAFLILVVYSNSSLARLLLVMSFPLFLYLYRNGLLFPRHNNRQQLDEPVAPRERPRVENDDEQDAPDEPQVNGLRARRAVSFQLAHSPEADNNSSLMVERSSSVRMIWLVVSSFLTSLIPEQPHFDLN